MSYEKYGSCYYDNCSEHEWAPHEQYSSDFSCLYMDDAPNYMCQWLSILYGTTGFDYLNHVKKLEEWYHWKKLQKKLNKAF